MEIKTQKDLDRWVDIGEKYRLNYMNCRSNANSIGMEFWANIIATTCLEIADIVKLNPHLRVKKV